MRPWLIGALVVAPLTMSFELAAQDYPPEVARGKAV